MPSRAFGAERTVTNQRATLLFMEHDMHMPRRVAIRLYRAQSGSTYHNATARQAAGTTGLCEPPVQ